MENVVRKPVENEQTVPLKRIVHKLDLKTIYPLSANDSLLTYNVSVVRTAASPNFKTNYQFVYERDSIYFLTSLNRPATLRLNVFLNSTMKPGVTELRKYTRVFNVREEKPVKRHVFELQVDNQIEEILSAEKTLLQQFESKLWKGGRASLAYIRPGNHTYKIGIASSHGHSDLLDEICFLNNIPADQLKIAGLNVIRSEAKCKYVAGVHSQPGEEIVVNAFVNVGLKSRIADRHIALIIPVVLAGVMMATGAW